MKCLWFEHQFSLSYRTLKVLCNKSMISHQKFRSEVDDSDKDDGFEHKQKVWTLICPWHSFPEVVVNIKRSSCSQSSSYLLKGNRATKSKNLEWSKKISRQNSLNLFLKCENLFSSKFIPRKSLYLRDVSKVPQSTINLDLHAMMTPRE